MACGKLIIHFGSELLHEDGLGGFGPSDVIEGHGAEELKVLLGSGEAVDAFFRVTRSLWRRRDLPWYFPY